MQLSSSLNSVWLGFSCSPNFCQFPFLLLLGSLVTNALTQDSCYVISFPHTTRFLHGLSGTLTPASTEMKMVPKCEVSNHMILLVPKRGEGKSQSYMYLEDCLGSRTGDYRGKSVLAYCIQRMTRETVRMEDRQQSGGVNSRSFMDYFNDSSFY